MIPRAIADISAADIEALIEHTEEEGPTLDFKRDLPGRDRDSRKEFVADVCAFANTRGGDLVYGIEEDEEGRASRVEPNVFNPDEVVNQLTSVLTDLLEPRLHGVSMRTIEVGEAGGRVLVVRVPRSVAGIHRSRADAHFWIRESRSKRSLDVPGILSRVGDLLGREDRVADFFARRYAAICGGTYPLALQPGPKVAVHILPARDIFSGEETDLTAVAQPGSFFVMPRARSGEATRTFEGVIHHSPVQEGAVRAATLLFHSGIVEAVAVGIRRNAGPEEDYLPLEAVEATCVQFLESALPVVVDHLAGGYPVTVRIAITSASDTVGRSSNRDLLWDFQGMPPVRVHAPVLVLPDVLVDQEPVSVPRLLRPTFDRLWQSWGYPRCFSFQQREQTTLWQRQPV